MAYRPGPSVKQAHSDSIWSVNWTKNAALKDDNRVLTGSVEDVAKVWSVDNSPASSPADEEQKTSNDDASPVKCVHDLPGHFLGATSMVSNFDSTQCATSSLDGKIRVFNLADGEMTSEITAPQVWKIAYCPTSASSKLVAAGTQTGLINIYNTETREKLTTFKSDDTEGGKDDDADRNSRLFIMAIAYSPDGKKIAVGRHDGTVNVYDVETQKEVMKVKDRVKPIRSLQFTLDDLGTGLLLLVTADDFRVNIYDVEHNSIVSSLAGHTSWVLDVAVSPRGNIFATAGADQKVKIWKLGMGPPVASAAGGRSTDTSTKRCLHTFSNSHTDNVWSLSFNHDGSKLVSGGEDGLLQFYDIPK